MAERDISTWNDSNFFNICSDGDLETLRIYLRKLSRTDISSIRDPHGATLAHHAARYGHVHILRYFVEEKHLDLTQLQTEHRASCAHDAAVCDQVEAMKYLLHYRHETHSPLRWNFRDDHGNTTLHLAAQFGSINVLQYLLEFESADPCISSDEGFIPIHYAALYGHDETIKCLLSFAPETINAQTKNLLTPLSLSCQAGMFDSVQLLISRGAQTKIKDEHGRSSLHWACWKTHMNIVKLLIETGNGHIDDVDHMNQSSLHYASATNNQLLINYLLDRNARIILSNDGNSPLHVAAENGHLETCLTLINRTSCSVSQTNRMGFTPIDLANQHGYPVLVNELRLCQTLVPTPTPTPTATTTTTTTTSPTTTMTTKTNESKDTIHLSNATVVRLVVKKRNIQRMDASNQVNEEDLMDNAPFFPVNLHSNGSTSSKNLTNNRFELSELRARVEEHEASRNGSLGINNTVSDVLMHSLESLNQQNKRRSRSKLPTQTYAPWLKMSNLTPKDFHEEIQKVGANLRKVRQNSETNENEDNSDRRTRESQSMGPLVLPKSTSSTDFSSSNLHHRQSSKPPGENKLEIKDRSSISVSKSHQFITPTTTTSNGEIPQWRRALAERRRAMVTGGTDS